MIAKLFGGDVDETDHILRENSPYLFPVTGELFSQASLSWN